MQSNKILSISIHIAHFDMFLYVNQSSQSGWSHHRISTFQLKNIYNKTEHKICSLLSNNENLDYEKWLVYSL